MTTYKYLGPRRGSMYRQFFVNGTGTRAETIDRAVNGVDPRTPEQVARDFELPLEAVLECIDYAAKNADLLRQERDEDLADMIKKGYIKPAPWDNGSVSS
jgi:uncharacterized protein (DUF433 family)